jgi:hypothetical protein
MMYQFSKLGFNQTAHSSIIRTADGACIPFDPANTDYQAFKKAVLEQEPGGAVVEDGESFSLNTNPDASILEDADGNVMTIEQAKEYVRGLP